MKPDNNAMAVKVAHAELWYDGQKALDEFVTVKDSMVYINRTAQVTNETSIMLKMTLSTQTAPSVPGAYHSGNCPERP
ncbi:MAG: hypothetical protein QM664_09565 [Flavihumibacter sp.]